MGRSYKYGAYYVQQLLFWEQEKESLGKFHWESSFWERIGHKTNILPWVYPCLEQQMCCDNLNKISAPESFSVLFFIHFPWWLFKRTVSWFCSREYFQTWQHYLLSQCKESEIIFSWVFELWGQWTEFRLWKLQVTYTCCHLRKAFLVCHYFCIWHSDHCIDVHAVLYPRLVEIWAASCHLCYSEGTLFSFLRQDDKPCENFGSKEINLVSFTE